MNLNFYSLARKPTTGIAKVDQAVQGRRFINLNLTIWKSQLEKGLRINVKLIKNSSLDRHH